MKMKQQLIPLPYILLNVAKSDRTEERAYRLSLSKERKPEISKLSRASGALWSSLISMRLLSD